MLFDGLPMLGRPLSHAIAKRLFERAISRLTQSQVAAALVEMDGPVLVGALYALVTDSVQFFEVSLFKSRRAYELFRPKTAAAFDPSRHLTNRYGDQFRLDTVAALHRQHAQAAVADPDVAVFLLRHDLTWFAVPGLSDRFNDERASSSTRWRRVADLAQTSDGVRHAVKIGRRISAETREKSEVVQAEWENAKVAGENGENAVRQALAAYGWSDDSVMVNARLWSSPRTRAKEATTAQKRVGRSKNPATGAPAGMKPGRSGITQVAAERAAFENSMIGRALAAVGDETR